MRQRRNHDLRHYSSEHEQPGVWRRLVDELVAALSPNVIYSLVLFGYIQDRIVIF